MYGKYLDHCNSSLVNLSHHPSQLLHYSFSREPSLLARSVSAEYLGDSKIPSGSLPQLPDGGGGGGRDVGEAAVEEKYFHNLVLQCCRSLLIQEVLCDHPR